MVALLPNFCKKPLGRNDYSSERTLHLAESKMTNWSQIVEEHGPIVWKTVRRLSGNEADAADCFQQTFLAAVELARQQPVRHWPAVLRRLATARALDRLRATIRNRRRHAPLNVDPSTEKAGDHPLPMVEARELAERLRVALAAIDPRQAQVFCLTQLEGLSYDDVATQLGLTTSHVGVLLSRARGTLKERLAAFAPNRAITDKPKV
jgi:RNA polymerase sigma-70 factor (ECF subfamily)